jgi:hypothetical protein
MLSKKIFSAALVVFLAISMIIVVAASYVKYVINQDYYLYAQVSCDPVTEDCFTRSCDIDGNCSEEGLSTYYKVIYKKAFDVPYCNPYSELGCEELTCSLNEDCKVITCSQNTHLYETIDQCN